MDDTFVQNLILYDWVSFTTKKHTPEELIAALGLQGCSWQETKGARGYRDRLYFDCISVHYNGREDMGVWLEMSGQGCRTFESCSDMGWTKLFEFIRTHELHMTRLDVAYDDHTGILPLEQIAVDVEQHHYISKSTKWDVHKSGTIGKEAVGLTVQIGSPRSAVLIRIYDKAVERGAEDGEHWVRCEMQLRDDRAMQFIQIPKPIGEAYAGVLLNYLRFVVPSESDSNMSRWEMTDYWAALVGDAEKISIFTAPGTEYNEERCRNFVFNQAGNAIDACIRMYGLRDFGSMILHRPCSPNPKYQRLVTRYHAERLANSIRDWFDVETPIEPPVEFPEYPFDDLSVVCLNTGEVLPFSVNGRGER